MANIEKTDTGKIEDLLKNYKILKIEIEAIKINIKSIGQRAMNYTGMPSSGGISNRVHSDLNELEKLKNEKFDKEIEIEHIDNMLNILNEEEYKIIKLRYFDELEIYKIAHYVNMHPNTVSNKRTKIFDEKLIPYAKRLKLI